MTGVAPRGERSELEELTARAIDLHEQRPQEARPHAERASTLARQLGDRSSLAWNSYVLGSCSLDSGDYGSAEGALRSALELAREVDDQALVIRILRSLLKCGFYTRDHDVAVRCGIEALQIAREIGDQEALARVYNDLGLVFGNGGDFEGALEHLLAGLRIMRGSGASRLASVLNNIGNVYFELGDFREARTFFHSALEGFREDGGQRGEGIALGNIGRASAALGDDTAALEAYRRSLEVFEASGDPTYRAAALARLGSALAKLGRRDEAIAAFGPALDAIESSPHREFADEVLTAAGRFHLQHGEPDRAITLLSAGLAILPANDRTLRAAALHESLAEAHERKGELTEALRHYKEYHRIGQELSDTAATVRIRGLMLRFDVERARQQEELFRLRNVELANANQELQALRDRLEATNRELHQISIEDSLTGLHNRRYLDLQLGVELQRAQRHDRPLCVAMGDVDHFKEVNDRYSHATGDEVLRLVARIFQESARATDIVVRYGGEEFVLVLPDTDLMGAAVLTERIRRRVSEHGWDELAPDLRVTLSIGVAQFDHSGDASQLLAAADERLYAAKQAGRDRVVPEG